MPRGTRGGFRRDPGSGALVHQPTRYPVDQRIGGGGGGGTGPPGPPGPPGATGATGPPGIGDIAGGVGITNTPEPIVGTGVIDLDIFSLTTEAALANGDWFPFVDVSVGTTPADQRKATLADLAAYVGAIAGSGTVTSVAGGVGITNTPDPIVTTGTVDLDINSLTSEPSLATGDLFAFVDVSVGTTPAAQRKGTLGNLATGLEPLLDLANLSGQVAWTTQIDFTGSSLTDLATASHSDLSNLLVDDHTQYALLAGRSPGQTLYGGGTGEDLNLRSNPSNDGAVIIGGTGSPGSPQLFASTPLNLNASIGRFFSLILIPGDPNIVGGDSPTTGDLVLWSNGVQTGSIFLGALLEADEVSGVITIPGADLSINGLPYVWPATESANRVLKTDGSSNLSWGQVAYSEITGTPTLVTDHGALTGLVPDDDHTQYLLLAGRPGGQVGYGSTLSTQGLQLRSNPFNDGLVVLGTGFFGTGVTVDETTNFVWLTGTKIIIGPNLTDIGGVSYTWPGANAAGVLTNNGAGILSWAAAATGTVTSVAGGVGITNTPEPIVGAGTVDLDINSLTTETTVASGDLFAFVDVSVGTAPSAQRKASLATLVTGLNGLLDHGTLAGLVPDDDHTQYLLLAGRAGGQIANGGTATGDHLDLFANDDTWTSGEAGRIRMRSRVSFPESWTVTTAVALNLLEMTATYPFPSSSISLLHGLYFVPTITYTGQQVLSRAIGVYSAPLIQPTATVADNTTTWYSILSLPKWAPTATGCTTTRMTGVGSGPKAVPTTGASTISTLSAFTSWPSMFDDANALNSAITVTSLIHYECLNPAEASTPTVTQQVGLYIPGWTRGTSKLSIESAGADNEMRHAGAAVFAADAPKTNASVGLEVQSTTKAFMLSRMSRAQRNTLAGVAINDGMVVFENDTPLVTTTARNGGQWVELPGWDICVSKAADQSTTSATLQDDTDLQFTVAQNEAWFVELILAIAGSDTTGDGKFQLLATVATFANSWRSGVFFGAGGALDTSLFTPAAFTSTTAMVTAGGLTILNGDATLFPVYFKGFFRASAAATIKVQFAVVAASGARSCTMQSGSILRAKRMI